jgi:hypothetical protein
MVPTTPLVPTAVHVQWAGSVGTKLGSPRSKLGLRHGRGREITGVSTVQHRVRGGQSPCSRAEDHLQAGKQPPLPSTCSAGDAVTGAGGAETSSTWSWAKLSPPDQKDKLDTAALANEDTEGPLRVLGTPRRDQRAHENDLAASVWAKLSPNQPPHQPPDLGLPLGGREGGLKGHGKMLRGGKHERFAESLVHCGHFAALPSVSMPANPSS